MTSILLCYEELATGYTGVFRLPRVPQQIHLLPELFAFHPKITCK